MPDFNVFYIRNNFKNDTLRNKFFKNNQAAIHVDQPYEIEDWGLLKKGKPGKNKKTEFIRRWFKLNTSLQEKDALLVTSYQGSDTYKVGLLKKGSTYFELAENKEYKVFQLLEHVDIDINKHQIFKSLIPAQTTISPIKKRKGFVISKYTGVPLKMTLENISDTSLEVMCAEWLRTTLAPKRIRLKYQLLRTGGNFPDIDIYGVTVGGKELAAQVSSSKSKNTITLKEKQLLKNENKVKLMFSDFDSDSKSVVENISIRDVFQDLYKNGYKSLIEALILQ